MQPSELPALSFPRTYPLDLRQVDGRAVVYDPLRRRCVPLTPEEWVRQTLLQFLIQDRGCPAGLTAVEHTLDFHGKPFRADVVVHDRQARPLLLVECKEPGVRVDAGTFEQTANYNRVLRAPYLLVTNGVTHACCRWDADTATWAFLADIPTYEAMLAGATTPR